MDCGTENPPTSKTPPEKSKFSQVIFTNVPTSYNYKNELRCAFHRQENFIGSPKDWIGIFKVAWKTTRDYWTWISTRTSVNDTVLFKSYYLPRGEDDYFQFCYVDHNGEVRGASIPFQFRENITEAEDEDDILMVTTEVEMMRTNEENAELKKALEKATEENSVLQEKVSSLQNENQTQSGRIQSLQDELLNSTEKMQRLETENMELTVQTKNQEDEIERIKSTIQSLNIDLQMQRSQEEKLLSEMKEMERTKDNLQVEKNHFEKLQIHMKILEEKTEKLESELRLYREKELKFLSEREELEKSLEKSVAEKNQFQNEDLAKQKVMENLTLSANQCKEETLKLKAELELQTCALESEKKQKQTLKQSLDKELRKVLVLESDMEQKTEKLRSTEEMMTGLSKQMELLKAENENKMKQMGMLHMTIAHLEGEVKRMKDECQSKMEVERIVRELRTQLKSTEEAMHGMEVRLAQQQDTCREQGEEMFALRSTVELREAEIQDLKDVLKANRIEIDDLNSHLMHRAPTTTSVPTNPALMFGNPYEAIPFSMEYESMASSAAGEPSSLLKCPVCSETFFPHQRQIMEDHVMCHLVMEEAAQ